MNRFAILRLILVLLGLIASSGVPTGLAVNVMVALGQGFVVNSSEYLSFHDKYYLVMQPDCDLVLYNQSGLPLLHTDSSKLLDGKGDGNPLNCSLWMQSDGNLVIYNLTSANWANKTTSSAVWAQGYANAVEGSHSFLLLGGDGSLEYYNTNTTRRENSIFNGRNITAGLLRYPSFDPNSTQYRPWKPYTSFNEEFAYMPTEYYLSSGERLRSLSKNYLLELRASDCNLQSSQIRYDGGLDRLLWNTSTSGLENRTCQLELLQNGILQIRDQSSSEVYFNVSDNAGNTSLSWILKVDPDNGTLSVSDITNPSNILWSNKKDSLPPIILVQDTTSNRTIVWILVGVIGGAFVLALTALGLYFYARDCFLDPADKAFQKRLRDNGGNAQALSQAKIKQVTKSFERVIGHGGFGDVFYGKLPDGQEVAAKVLSANSHQSKQEFYNEIELLSKVHHKYLVSLLGYSCGRKHQTLIYEYMGGGDLQHRLQGETGAVNPLSWRQRTSIILEVAEGLEYLHDKCCPPIIHRDVKSSNILLTNNLVAKVADFGLSKLKAIGQEDATHVTTVVKGTPGYLDPEYHETGLLTEKSDVYAFGVVLMEILTGRHPMNIAQRVGDDWRKGQFNGLADPNLGQDFITDELFSLVELALWCVRRSNMERPLIRQVVRRLHELLLVPTEVSQRDSELGEEGQRAAMNIELMMMDSEKFSSETAPLSSSSSTGVSFEVRHHTVQLRSRSQLGW